MSAIHIQSSKKKLVGRTIMLLGLCCLLIVMDKKFVLASTKNSKTESTDSMTLNEKEYTILPSDRYNAVSIGPYEVEIDQTNHTVKLMTAYLNGYEAECPTEVILPSELKADGETYKVTAIAGGFPAYNMERLVVPEGIESIGPEFCTGGGTLKEVTIPSTVTQIDVPFLTFTFTDKNKFELQIAEDNPAYQIQNHSLMTMDGKTLIRSFASGEYVVSNGVETIDTKCFYRNNRITKVVIPAGVKKIKARTFSLCKNLKEVDMPNTVTSLGQSLFADSKSLEKVTLSKKIKSIPNYCFRDSGIQVVEVPEGVTKIGTDAFLRCNSLEKLTLPATLRNIEANPLFLSDVASGNGVPVLKPKNLMISKNNPNYTIENGVLMNKKKTRIIQMIAADKTFTIPATVKTIDEGAFSHQLQLQKIILSKNITEIPKDAFSFSSVETVVCTSSLRKIGKNAFSCSGLKSIDLKKGVTTIVDGAFINCNSLESITIPETVTKIGDYVFYQECGKIRITFQGSTPPEIGCLENSYSDEAQTGYEIYVPKKSLKKYENALQKKNKELKIAIKGIS